MGKEIGSEVYNYATDTPTIIKPVGTALWLGVWPVKKNK